MESTPRPVTQISCTKVDERSHVANCHGVRIFVTCELCDHEALCACGDSMPTYRFTLYKDGRHTDLVSSYLSDDEAAIKEAAEIVRDMKGDKPGWWDGWTLRVTAGERKVSEISFIEAN
jgi:hypothetical protein